MTCLVTANPTQHSYALALALARRVSPLHWRLLEARQDTHTSLCCAADIISAVEFDQTGQHLATGDRGGRVVLFERLSAPQVQPQDCTCHVQDLQPYSCSTGCCCSQAVSELSWLSCCKALSAVTDGGQCCWVEALAADSSSECQTYDCGQTVEASAAAADRPLDDMLKVVPLQRQAPIDQRSTPPLSSFEYRYLTEFQSHEPEFDYLKSLEIEEKINRLRWLNVPSSSRMVLSTNDKTIKLWKVCLPSQLGQR